MPNTYTPAAFLREFEAVYETLDLRVAAIKYQQEWVLVAGSARFRVIPMDAAKKEFEGLGKRFGKVDSPAFRIVQQCLPIVGSRAFFEDLSRGKLIVNDLRIGLSSPQDVLSFAGHPRVDWQRHDRWPSIEVRRQIDKNDGGKQALLDDALTLRATELAGYEYPHIAVRTLLDIDYSQSTEAGYLSIECDIPVRLLDPIVRRHDNELDLVLRAQSHIAVQDVACTVRHTRGGSEVIRQSVVNLTRGDNESPRLAVWTGEFRMHMPEELDQVMLEALSSSVGRLYSLRIRPLDLLPFAHANPLLAALEVFCSADQMRLLLEEPQKAQIEVPSGRNQARVFEVSIQWLLSALGFRAIWLHAFEKAKDGNVELGTVDCLAYSEEQNLLVLVNCSLAAPDPRELHRQENLVTRLRQQVLGDSRITVQAALFTAAHKPEAEQSERYGSAVRVFFKEDLAALLKAARAGHRLGNEAFMRPSSDWTSAR